MSESESHHRRIVEELCAVLGQTANAHLLLEGGAMKIDKYAVWLVHDAPFDPGHMFVYVDLGVPSDPAVAYKRLLKLNFELGAGVRGVMSLHPENDRVLYTFRYPLTAASSGQDLLKTLLRFAGGVSPDGAENKPGSFSG